MMGAGLAAPNFSDKKDVPKEKEKNIVKKPDGIMRLWRIGEGIVIKREDFLKVVGVIGKGVAQQAKEGGSVDICFGELVQCQVIPLTGGIDSIHALVQQDDKEPPEEVCIILE